MHTITWSSGRVDQAPTWQAMLDLVRADQWAEYDSEDGFRAELAKRAYRWSTTAIDIGAPPRRFFLELERARLIIIERSK
jgi:hypothetical protein